MARTTKAERAEAAARLREYLVQCGPVGRSTLMITLAGGRGTNDYFEIRVVRALREDKRPIRTAWLNLLVAKAFGLRLSGHRVAMGGGGYNKSLELASHLARIAGHRLTVDLDGCDQREVKP